MSELKSREDYEDILPESSTQLVSLNTRIPRSVSHLIDECVGILQIESKYHKVTKQEAVIILLETGIHTIRSKFMGFDELPLEEFESIENRPDDTVEVIEDIERIERTIKTQRTFDMKAYAEMANKTYYNGPEKRTRKEPSESAKLLQTKLGLR